MKFLANPQGFSPEGFKAYVAACRWTTWKPKFIVLHNSGEPNLKQWNHGSGEAYERQRILNLNHYYKTLGWHSGPHLFIAPSRIWVACDLVNDGVHASCFNHQSIGVEMVGDYSTEKFDSGDGAKVRDLTIQALAILHHALGIDPATLHFHKECVADHHDCPGKFVDKARMIASIKAAMAPKGVGHADAPVAPVARVAAPKTPALAAHVEELTAEANRKNRGRQDQGCGDCS